MIPPVLNRYEAPPLAPLKAPRLPTPRMIRLRNGLESFLLPFGRQPVVECQIVLWGGKSAEALPGLAQATLRMLSEGTAHRTAQQISEVLDTLGASLQVNAGHHTATLQLSVLERNLAPALALVQELLVFPRFPEAEWERQLQQWQQQLQIQQQRTQYHAQQAFFEGLFGRHPYGYLETPEDLTALGRAQLPNYWAATLRPLRGFVLVAGQFDSESLGTTLEEALGILQRPDPGPNPAHPISLAARGTLFREVPGSVQTTLYVGHEGPKRTAPHYYARKLLGTILGGYFGSRLMQRLREERGYTYGIGGGFTAYRDGGYLCFRCDLAPQYAEPAIELIQEEFVRLRSEPVPFDELERARQYLLGRFVAQQETPFQVADIFKSLYLHGLPITTYLEGFEEIRRTGPQELLALAQTDLRPEDLWVASAGTQTGSPQ